MRIPAREPINVATWLSLRFERGTRFSQSRLEQHLCGAWIVTGVNGRRNARLGRTLMTWSGFFEAGGIGDASPAARLCPGGPIYLDLL